MNVSKNNIFVKFYQDRDLTYIMKCIYFCYLEILKSNITINNDENEIRDLFISEKYLDNYLIKEQLGISQYKFDKEIQTKDGRVDIRVLDMVKTMKGESTPYYFIECKRLDGINNHYKDSLNNKYVENGINRFIIEKYPTYLEANGMLGFVINSIDIKENSRNIRYLEPFKFIKNFEYSYISNHVTTANKEVVLYHLMLDFSNKINFTK